MNFMREAYYVTVQGRNIANTLETALHTTLREPIIALELFQNLLQDTRPKYIRVAVLPAPCWDSLARLCAKVPIKLQGASMGDSMNTSKQCKHCLEY